MIRCSDLCILLALAPLAAPAAAEPFQSDAFGLFDPATTAAERREWSGWAERGGSVLPEEADRLVIFAGPKSMVAGKDPGHVVAVAMDRHGNLVADGTASQVTIAGDMTATTTHGGIADLLVTPRTLATNLFVGVSVGARQSPKAMLSVTADIASIRPQLTTPPPDVQSDSEFALSTRPLTDRFGNEAPDGTGVTTILQHTDGSFSLAHGLVLQDRPTTRFIARDIPGVAVAAMTLGRQTATPLGLLVQSPQAAGLLDLELEPAPEIAATRLRLGPFLTTAGYALSDGVQVDVTAQLGSGQSHTETAWVIDGEVSLLFPFPPTADLRALTVSSPLGAMDLTAAWATASQAAP